MDFNISIRLNLAYLLCLFLFQTYYWWKAWELKEASWEERFHLDFLVYLGHLVAPLLLYSATAFLCRDIDESVTLSMEEYFSAQSRRFYTLIGLLILTLIAMALPGVETWPNDRVALLVRGGSFLVIPVAFIVGP